MFKDIYQSQAYIGGVAIIKFISSPGIMNVVYICKHRTFCNMLSMSCALTLLNIAKNLCFYTGNKVANVSWKNTEYFLNPSHSSGNKIM